MLRHGCGFKLANDGVDTRALQHYLGHRSITHTVPSYAPTAAMGSGRIDLPRTSHEACASDAPAQV
jgi:integrase